MDVKAQAIFYYSPLPKGDLTYLATFHLKRNEAGDLVWRLTDFYNYRETRVSHFLPLLAADSLYLGAYRKPGLVSQVILSYPIKVNYDMPFSDKIFQLAMQGKLTWWQTLKHKYIKWMGY